MARPTRCRRICVEPAYDSFRPEGILTGERIHMTVDEYEAIRLIDLEKRTHEQCAEQMGISRYICMESQEMTSPSSRLASSAPSRVLPEAVGPAMMSTLIGFV